MKIAIIGSGISGLTAARCLHAKHDIRVFEANDRIGGHSNTVMVEDGHLPVDTGFIVFNNRNYPNFVRLLDILGVESQETNMSFSIKCENTGLEYNGTTLNSLFAQRRNLLKIRFWVMISEILKFNKESKIDAFKGDYDISLGSYLDKKRYGKLFVENYIIPMGAAIWSATREDMWNYPLRRFVEFFDNHGMLSVDDRPTWRTVSGGSKEYVKKLISPFKDKIQTNSKVLDMNRSEDKVELVFESGSDSFDKVIFACHSDQALKILGEKASDLEKEILGALPYQKNIATLHTDASLMPKKKLAWAAWNYHLTNKRSEDAPVAVTYNMNILQHLKTETDYMVTLNYDEAIDPSKVIKRIEYSHPIFLEKGMLAQQRKDEICGQKNTYFAGAYWRYGFHEDGVMSGIDAAAKLGGELI